MWALASTISFPFGYPNPLPQLTIRNSLSNPNSLSLRASLFDYPPASRIVVKNLSYSTQENCLEKEFSNFGQIAEVRLVKDEDTKRSKGYAFVQYNCQDDAMLALENMDQKNFDGRVIYIELAKPGSGSTGGYPRTSGPPKAQPLQEQVDTEYWY